MQQRTLEELNQDDQVEDLLQATEDQVAVEQLLQLHDQFDLSQVQQPQNNWQQDNCQQDNWQQWHINFPSIPSEPPVQQQHYYQQQQPHESLDDIIAAFMS